MLLRVIADSMALSPSVRTHSKCTQNNAFLSESSWHLLIISSLLSPANSNYLFLWEINWISSSSCLNAVRHTPWVLVQHLTGREQLLVEADPGLVSPINTACVFLRTVVLALFKPRMEKHSKIYNERDSDTHTNKALIHRMFRQDAPSFLLLLAMKLRAAALGLHTVVSDFQ